MFAKVINKTLKEQQVQITETRRIESKGDGEKKTVFKRGKSDKTQDTKPVCKAMKNGIPDKVSPNDGSIA